MALLLMLNLVVFASACAVCRRFFDFKGYAEDSDGLVDFLIAAFLVYLAQVILTELVLGLTGRLRLINLVMLNLAVSAIIYIGLRGKRPRPSLTITLGSLKSALGNKLILFAVSIILAFGAVKTLVNLVNPPFGWDSLNYHFTFAVEWLKHANLTNPITINDDFAPTYYPVNGSLYFFWLIAPLRSVFLADLGQLPFFIICFFAVYSICRKLALNKENAFYAAAAFVLTPNFFKQLQIAYVDVMVAAFFLISVNFLFKLAEDFSRRNILFFGLGLGLLIGTKLIALPYSLLLIIPFVYLWFKDKRVNKIQGALAVLLPVALLGSFSYIRNFIETGNPLYPLNVELSGRTIFRGVVDRASYIMHFNPGDHRITKILFHEGMGPATLLFVLPAAILGIPLAFWKPRPKTNSFMVRYFLLLPALIYLVYRYVIPLANTRYLYPLLGVGMAAAFYIAASFKIPRVLIRIVVFLCFFGSIFELAKKQELAASIILTVALFLFLPWIIGRVSRARLFTHPVFLVILILAAAFILSEAEARYVKYEFRRYVLMTKYSGFWPEAAIAWEWLNNNTTGNNIAYVGRPVPFPLYGRRFKNNVYYVSVNTADPARLEDYPGSFYKWDGDYSHKQKDFEAPSNYRGGADYSVWLANLARRNTDYLFVYSLHQTKNIEFPMEDGWAKSDPDKFIPVFSSSTIRIYKIVR